MYGIRKIVVSLHLKSLHRLVGLGIINWYDCANYLNGKLFFIYSDKYSDLRLFGELMEKSRMIRRKYGLAMILLWLQKLDVFV